MINIKCFNKQKIFVSFKDSLVQKADKPNSKVSLFVRNKPTFIFNKIKQPIQRNFTSFSVEPEIFDGEKLKENTKTANELVDYVRSKITKVASWGVEPPFTEEKYSTLEETNTMLGDLRTRWKEICLKQPREKLNEFVSSSIFAYLAKQSGCGNCGEIACLGLTHLSEIGWEGRAGIFKVARPQEGPLPEGIPLARFSTHTFVIVGLGPNSKVANNDHQSFGLHAVVADAYAKEEPHQVYRVSEIHDKMHNYYGLDNHCVPMLAKIDPKIDTIQLLCSNMFSANEFVEPFLLYKNLKENTIAIANSLNSFNTSKSKEQKLKIADEIINQIPASSNTLNIMEKEMDGFFSEQKNKIAQIVEMLKTGADMDEYNQQFLKMAQVFTLNLKQITRCQDNLSTLSSQLSKFKDFGTQLFEIEQI